MCQFLGPFILNKMAVFLNWSLLTVSKYKKFVYTTTTKKSTPIKPKLNINLSDFSGWSRLFAFQFTSFTVSIITIHQLTVSYSALEIFYCKSVCVKSALKVYRTAPKHLAFSGPEVTLLMIYCSQRRRFGSELPLIPDFASHFRSCLLTVYSRMAYSCVSVYESHTESFSVHICPLLRRQCFFIFDETTIRLGRIQCSRAKTLWKPFISYNWREL